MKQAIAVLALALAASAQTPTPVPAPATPAIFAKPTAEQKLKIRDAQVQVRDITAQMNQIAEFFKGLQASLAAAQKAEKTAREEAKEANHCADCGFTDTLDLEKPQPGDVSGPAAKPAEPAQKP